MQSKSPSPILPGSSTRWAIIGLFFLLVLLVYGRTLHYPFVRWDDGPLIYENAMIREISPKSLKKAFTTYDPELYIPLTFVSFQADYALGGASPSMYHFTNLLLHTLNALLVAVLGLLLTRRSSVALLLGILFAVHPVHTEAVAWATARKDLLSTFFFLGSVVTYLLFVQNGRQRTYWLSVATFFFALLAKVTILSLPIILLLIDWYEERLSKRTLLEKIPFFALAILFGVVGLVGKATVITEITPWETLLLCIKAIPFYLGKLVAPFGLSVLYPHEGPIALSSPAFFVPLAALAALTVTVFFLRRRNRTLLFCSAFFLLTLLPSLPNFAKGGSIYLASDRYAYIPSIGFLLLLALCICALRTRAAVVTSAVLCITLAVLAALQSLTWRDTEALFTNALRTAPRSFAAHNNLGNEYRTQGKIEEALASYESAWEFGSDAPYSSDEQQAMILGNLASAKRTLGKLSEAEAHLNEALRIAPDDAQTHLRNGILLQTQGKIEDAEAAFRKATELEPALATAHINLGALAVRQGRIDEGIAAYDAAIAVNPFYSQAYYNKGVALRKLARNREALDAYAKAVELQPSYVAARINLGILYAERRKTDEAIAQFREVLKLDPGNTHATSALRQLGVL